MLQAQLPPVKSFAHFSPSPLSLRISVTTGAMKRAPRKVAVVARTTRNVTIQWVEDECAKAYVIGVYSLDSGEFLRVTYALVMHACTPFAFGRFRKASLCSVALLVIKFFHKSRFAFFLVITRR